MFQRKPFANNLELGLLCQLCRVLFHLKHLRMPLFYSPQGSHGDYSVPKRGWNGIKGGLLDILFTVEHDGGEDDDGHGEAEHQEAELGGAALEGVAEYPEALGMSGELENAEHAEHSKGDKGAADLTVICHQEPDVVRHDGHEINH